MAELGIGVIGVGRIGAMHARLLAGQVAGASVVAVTDPLADTAASLGNELGVGVAEDGGRGR